MTGEQGTDAFGLLRRKNGIARKLLAWFLLLALLPIALVTASATLLSARSYEEEVRTHLTALAEGREAQIETWAKERKRNVTAVALMPGMANTLLALESAFRQGGLESQAYLEADAAVRSFFDRYVEGSGYRDLLLVSESGDVVFTVKRAKDRGTNLRVGPYKATELAGVVERARTLLETEISDFRHYEPSGDTTTFIAAPVLSAGVVVGVVALRMEKAEIDRVVGEKTGSAPRARPSSPSGGATRPCSSRRPATIPRPRSSAR
jgi:hypothetical protein